jgi:copper transport protein
MATSRWFTRTTAHRLVTVVAVVAMAIIGVIATPDTAAAHAQLVKTTPVQGAHLSQMPATVSVEFDERLDNNAAEIKVFSAATKRVDKTVTRVSNRTVATQLQSGLPDGAYVVVWRAVSADGHPVRGSFTFQVGDGDQGALSALGDRELLSSSGNELTKGLLRSARYATFAAIALLIGAGVWVLAGLNLPTGRYIQIASGISLVGGTLAVLIDGPYVQGDSLSEMLSAQTLLNSLGRVTVRALLGASIVGFFLGRAILRTPRSRFEIGASIGIVSLLLGASGHGAAGRSVIIAILMTAAHVVAASTWIGGLVLLAVTLQRRSADGEGASLARWSSIAQVAVAVLAMSGSFNAWRQVGSVRALRTTWYGTLLIAKLVIVMAMLGAAAWHRRKLALHTIRSQTVFVEAVAGFAVLIFSSLLASTVPARSSVSRPVVVRVVTPTTKTDITFDPAQVGQNTVHLYVYDKVGVSKEIADASMVLTHVATGTQIEVLTFAAGRGHRQAIDVQLPFAGTWQALVKIFPTEFDVESAVVIVTVK